MIGDYGSGARRTFCVAPLNTELHPIKICAKIANSQRLGIFAFLKTRPVWIDLNFNLLTYITLSAATLSLLIQMAYYWGLFSRLAFFKSKNINNTDNEDLPAVSVVISARNAVLDLEKNLPYILYQDYPRFEVVVVNDSSDDGTEELLTELTVTNQNSISFTFART